MKNKQYTLLFLAAIAFFSTAIAQPRIKDQGVIGGGFDDVFSSMSITKDGGLIVGGYSYSDSGYEKTENRKGGYDYWVIKLDSNKNIQWDKTIGGYERDELHAVQQTADGGYILGGHSASNKSGDKTEKSRGEYDYWVVKLDAAGNKQWDKTIGGSSPDYLRAIQQTADGGYILGGYSYSGISGDKTEGNRGASYTTDYWVVKLDAAGTKQWDKTIGGINYDILRDLQQTADGGFILGGYSSSSISGDKTAARNGREDYWIVKLDGSGAIQWDRSFGGKSDDYLYSIQQTTNGGYILGGYSYSGISGNKTEASKGGADYWIVRTNDKGIPQWDKTIGGDYYDVLNDLQQTSDGGFILTGYSGSGISGDKTEANRGTADYWTVKTSSTGTVQWDKTVGGKYNDYAYAVSEIRKNDYVIGGYSQSPISGDKDGGTRGKGNGADYWLVELKYEKPDSVAVIAQVQNASRLVAPQSNTNGTFSIYPNPATTVLHIQNTGKATFVLTDLSGKRMLTKTINGNADLNVASIPAGTYYLTNIATHTTQKVVITK